jgi:hypothetical protein
LITVADGGMAGALNERWRGGQIGDSLGNQCISLWQWFGFAAPIMQLPFASVLRQKLAAVPMILRVAGIVAVNELGRVSAIGMFAELEVAKFDRKEMIEWRPGASVGHNGALSRHSRRDAVAFDDTAQRQNLFGFRAPQTMTIFRRIYRRRGATVILVDSLS